MNRPEFVRYDQKRGRGGKVSVNFFQEEDISKLVECMALNSASSSEEEESEASEVRMRT